MPDRFGLLGMTILENECYLRGSSVLKAGTAEMRVCLPGTLIV